MRKRSERTHRIPMRNIALEQVYPFIVKYANEHNGLTPVLQEIGDKFGVSKQQAKNYVQVLVQEDLVRVSKNRVRGIVLIGTLHKKLFKKDKK